MGWLQRKLGWESKKPIKYPRQHPENATQPYWYPVEARVDKSLLHAFERSLPAHVADILTSIEATHGKVTESLIIDLSTQELYVDAVVRIEPHNMQHPQIPQAPASLVPAPQSFDVAPEVRINPDGKIVEV
jgi:hypothetical protein